MTVSVTDLRPARRKRFTMVRPPPTRGTRRLQSAGGTISQPMLQAQLRMSRICAGPQPQQASAPPSSIAKPPAMAPQSQEQRAEDEME